MRQDLKHTFLWSLGLALLLTLALALGPSAALAQGKPAPGPNQAFLYEMSEDAQLCLFGTALVPGLGGILVSSGAPCTVQSLSAGLFRNAVSELQGVSALNSPLCPGAAFVTNPKSDTCTVTVTGHDSVQLDPTTFVPAGGAVWGSSAVVIQLDNPVDSPEWPLVPGAFYGTITFGNPGVPIGSATASFLIGVQVPPSVQQTDPAAFAAWFQPACAAAGTACVPFSAKFRQPFAMRANGDHKKARRGEEAFYLLDNGKLDKVRQDERAVGWPTVRFEITFTN
jgi:hypothetical protein